MPMSNPNMDALAEGHYAWCDPAFFDDEEEDPEEEDEDDEDDESDTEKGKVER